MNYIQAENRITGKPKFFTETGWRNLQRSNITHHYQKMKASASMPKNLIPNKAVQIPKDVLDFKTNQKTEAGAGAKFEAEELFRDFKMFPQGEKGDSAWSAWVAENGGTEADKIVVAESGTRPANSESGTQMPDQNLRPAIEKNPFKTNSKKEGSK